MEKMKIVPPVLLAFLLAIWAIAIAIISVQNSTALSLKFIVFQSVRLPVGIMLGFTVGVGVIAGAIAQPLWSILGQTNNQTESPDYEYD